LETTNKLCNKKETHSGINQKITRDGLSAHGREGGSWAPEELRSVQRSRSEGDLLNEKRKEKVQSGANTGREILGQNQKRLKQKTT